MTVVVSNKIWLEGSAAKAEGQPSSANPYPAGSQESADWLEGYTTAEAEQDVDSPNPGEARQTTKVRALDEMGSRILGGSLRGH